MRRAWVVVVLAVLVVVGSPPSTAFGVGRWAGGPGWLPMAPASARVPAEPSAVGGSVATVVPGPRFRWPLDGTPTVVRAFDPPAQPWLPGHRGVDLAGAPGAPVRAAGAGMVRFAGSVAGRGVVSVDHPGGLRTTYEPVTAVVHAGDRVGPGDLLGRLDAGHPGCAVDACLHWGLRRGDDYLDPLALLGLARVRLLPAPSTITGRVAGRGREAPRPAGRTRRRRCRSGRRGGGTRGQPTR